MPALLRWLLRLGPTNPVAVRLVQNGSRRPRHLYVRSIYLAVLIIVLLWSLLINTTAGNLDYRELAQAGALSFTVIAYLQIGLICVLAPVFMAGAIAQEANPKTWDILLTTPLSTAQIVLGNLLGRLFFVLSLLFASLPLFAITQYFGGVPGRAILASYAVAGCAALLVGAIAVSLSVSRLAGRRAVFAFYIAVVSYLGLTAALDAWLRLAGMGVGGAGVTSMTALNPFLALRALLNPSSYPVAAPGTFVGPKAWLLEHPVWTFCLGSVVISGLLIAASSLTVRLGGLAWIGSGDGGTPLHRRLLRVAGKGVEHRPPRAVWHNPVAWREAAARNATFLRTLSRWAFIGFGALFGVGLVFAFHIGSLSPLSFRLALLATVWTELAVTCLVAINMSATAASREREDGTLDLLLTTPITPKQYLGGKLRGLVAYLAPLLAVPVGTLLVAGIYVALADASGNANVTITDTPPGFRAPLSRPLLLPEAGVLMGIVAAPFIAACVVVGLHWSLRSKGTIGSVVSTVAVVGVVAGFMGLCGFYAGGDVPVIGPVLSAASPASLMQAMVYPEAGMREHVIQQGLLGARVTAAVGAVLGAIAYGIVVYAVQASMVKTFDMTVRKLSGMK